MSHPPFIGLMIEPTNLCNMHCPLCPTGSGGSGDLLKGSMSFKQFRDIVDQAADFLEVIRLWGFGEPFLAPDIVKMINYAGRKNIKIIIHTNGSILSKKMIGVFKKNYPLEISFSIDGVSPSVYNSYRKGGSLKVALNNLGVLVKLKEKYNLNNIRIIWQFLVTKYNQYEVSDVYQYAKRINVDTLRLKTICISKYDKLRQEFLPTINKYRGNDNYKNTNKLESPKNCFFINQGSPTISWQGDVVPCCQDAHWQLKMGNVFEQNLLDIWHSRKYKLFREQYKKGINAFCNEKCKFRKDFKVYFEEINFNI